MSSLARHSEPALADRKPLAEPDPSRSPSAAWQPDDPCRAAAPFGGAAPGSTGPERVLIIKPSSLGDIVHALPVLAAIRRRFPRARVAWMVGKSFAPLLEGHPWLDEIIPFDRRRYGQMWRSPAAAWAFMSFIRAIRRRRFDLILDLQGLIRSGLIAWFSGARRTVGFADARELAWLFYRERVRVSKDVRHAVERNLALAAAAGLSGAEAGAIDSASEAGAESPTAARLDLHALRAPQAFRGPSESRDPQSSDSHLALRPGDFHLALRPEELADAADLLARMTGRRIERFIAVAPGARWASKVWPPELLAEALKLLHERRAGEKPAHAQEAEAGPAVVLLGGPAERPLAEALLRQIPVGPARPIDLIGRTTLRQMVALLALAERVLCGDSGPMHIAAALGRPLVALFGPTDPAQTGPYSDQAQVLRTGIDCSPCFRTTCPLGHHRCLRDLTPQRVVEALLAQCSAAVGG